MMKKLVQVILKSLIFFAAWAAPVGAIPVPACDNPAVWRFWAECIPFGCIVLVNLCFWLIAVSYTHLDVYKRQDWNLQ